METSHESDWARGQWRALAETWQQAGHVELVSSMDEADTILITLADCKAPYPDTIASVARSGAYAEHPDKSFVFDTQDTPLGLYPGLYCSLRRLMFSASRHRTSCYMQSFNEFIGFAEAGPRRTSAISNSVTSTLWHRGCPRDSARPSRAASQSGRRTSHSLLL